MDVKVLTDEGYVKPSKKIYSETDTYFKFVFANCIGYLTATADHLWNIFDKEGNEVIETSEFIYNNFNFFAVDGKIKINNRESSKKYYIRKIEKKKGKDKKKFFCYELPTEQHQFFVYPKRNFIQEMICRKIYKDDLEVFGVKKPGVFVHNCQGRIGCGRLQSMSSMMLFGNTIGTSIDGNAKGAGIFSANSVLYNIQYFFESPDWIKNWYKKCGFSNMGYVIHGSYPEVKETEEEPQEDVDVSKEELDGIFDFKPEVSIFEYDENLRKEVNRTEKQSFD